MSPPFPTRAPPLVPCLDSFSFLTIFITLTLPLTAHLNVVLVADSYTLTESTLACSIFRVRFMLELLPPTALSLLQLLYRQAIV